MERRDRAEQPLVDAVIDALSVAGSYTVAVDPGASFLVDSLLVNTAQSASGIADSGTITVDGSAAIDSGLIDLTGELSAESVAVGGGLALAGGLLNATELTIDPSGSMGGYGNIAVGDTLAVGGLVDVSSGDLTLIANLMTLDGGQLDAGSGTLTLQVASFANLSGGALSGGNFEADNGGLLMLPQNAGITALQNSDLFLAGSGTIAYFDNSTGSIQAIQTELQSIDSLSELLIVGGATFAAQNPLLLDGRIDVVDGLLDAPGLTIDPSGLLLGIGIVEADNGTIINNGEILSGTGITSSLGNTVGDLLILGSVQGTGDLNVNVGTLELSTGSTEDVTLLGGGVLQLDAPITPGGSLYTGTITNLGATRASPAVIDLPNIVPTSLTIGYANIAGGAVVTARDNGATVAAFTFAGTHDLGEFTLGDDAFGGTEMTVACYAAGTRIRTDVGEMPIESLRPGDRLVTADNHALPVTWLGHRDICCDRHREPALVWPVRVRAGAFGDLLPGRDLWLSPDHAVFAAGVLIPVKCLINGASIVQVPVDRVTYWHVELSRHAVIFANGLAAESYLDTGNRAMFVNGASHLVLHPDFTALGVGERLREAGDGWSGDRRRKLPSSGAGPAIRLARCARSGRRSGERAHASRGSVARGPPQFPAAAGKPSGAT